MSQHLKLLLTAAFSTLAFAACSNEAAQVQPKTFEAAASSAAEDAAKQAAETAALAESEAREKAAAAKALMAKTEAEARAVKDAAAAQAANAATQAQDALAAKRAQEAETQRAQTAQNTRNAAAAAAKEADRVKQAQIARDAEQARNAEQLRQTQQRAQAVERQREAERVSAVQAAERQRDAARVQQAQSVAVSQPVISQPASIAAPAGPNAPYNAFLSKYVSPANGINLVAYDKVTPQDRAALRTYIETLSAMDIEALPRDAEMATWFNLYNAKTIELILENYPTKSIRKISNPWKKDRLVVNGKKMSLDDIEHGTVRRKYNEPRVHYAFNCASIGCPNVKSTAWEAATLEADLTQASRDFIGSERGVSVQGNKIVASSIFKWYKKDFGGNEAGVLAHLRQYATGPKKAALDAAGKINKYDYDWDLNIR